MARNILLWFDYLTGPNDANIPTAGLKNLSPHLPGDLSGKARRKFFACLP